MADPHDTRGSGSGDRRGSVTDDLASRIRRAQAEHPAEAETAEPRLESLRGMNRAFALVSEFVAATIVGAALGYGLDLVLGTRPWGTIILLLVGFVAGIVNVVRATRKLNAETAVPAGTPAAPDDDD